MEDVGAESRFLVSWVLVFDLKNKIDTTEDLGDLHCDSGVLSKENILFNSRPGEQAVTNCSLT